MLLLLKWKGYYKGENHTKQNKSSQALYAFDQNIAIYNIYFI